MKGYALFNGMRVGERVRVSISKRRVYGGCALFRLERKGSPHRNRTLYSCEHTSHAELVDRFTSACETQIMTSFRVPRGRRVAHDLIVRNLNEDPSKREHHWFFFSLTRLFRSNCNEAFSSDSLPKPVARSQSYKSLASAIAQISSDNLFHAYLAVPFWVTGEASPYPFIPGYQNFELMMRV